MPLDVTYWTAEFDALLTMLEPSWPYVAAAISIGLAVTVTADWVIFALASARAASEMLTFVPTARTDSRCDPLVAR